MSHYHPCDAKACAPMGTPDVPTLIAELRRHQAAVQAVRELADWLDSLHDPSYRFADAADRIRAAVAALDPKGTPDA